MISIDFLSLSFGIINILSLSDLFLFALTSLPKFTLFPFMRFGSFSLFKTKSSRKIKLTSSSSDVSWDAWPSVCGFVIVSTFWICFGFNFVLLITWRTPFQLFVIKNLMHTLNCSDKSVLGVEMCTELAGVKFGKDTFLLLSVSVLFRGLPPLACLQGCKTRLDSWAPKESDLEQAEGWRKKSWT